MNCLVDDYLGLRACRIFVTVHGVDLHLWCANIRCACIEEIYSDDPPKFTFEPASFMVR